MPDSENTGTCTLRSVVTTCTPRWAETGRSGHERAQRRGNDDVVIAFLPGRCYAHLFVPALPFPGKRLARTTPRHAWPPR